MAFRCRCLSAVRHVGRWGWQVFNFGNYISLIVSTSPLWTRQILERIATEFNQLHFHAVQSKGMPLLDKVIPASVGFDFQFAVCEFPG